MATPVGWMLGGGCLFSCSAIFGIDAPDPRDEPELAGAGGANAGSGGRSTGGAATGGRAGNGGGGGGGAVGNQPGTGGQTPGGAGGEGGSEDRGAILGEPCTDETQSNTACTSASPHLVLKCASGAWAVHTTCPSDRACVPERSNDEPADCVALSPSCTDSYTNVCRGENVLVDCETFRPFSVIRYCPYRCLDGACLPGTGDQLTVHTGTGSGAWFRPRTMPVCVLDANESDDEDLVGWIRDEVEHTWGRTYNYNFEGWTDCGTLPEAGVVLSFESECRGHLVNDIDPRSELVRLEICRSFYLEGDAELRPVEKPLARFLARHHFGHVIGVPDSISSGLPRTAMVRGIELTRTTEYEISPGELDVAKNYCGATCRKHPRALVTTRGRCLEVVDGSIVVRSCADHDDSEPQDFTLRGSELLTANPEQCVGISQPGQATVLAGECTTMSEHFALTGASLRSLGRCVTPASLPASPGTALWIGACDAVPESWTGWSFEVTGSTDNGLLARIRHDDLCVSVPGGAEAPSLVLELSPCETGDDQTDQTFELRHDGEIGFGELCLYWETLEGSVYLYDECGGVFNRQWTVTGALTTPSGLALTLGDGDAPATAMPLDAEAIETQTFDFYF
jgi:hypothetical protein